MTSANTSCMPVLSFLAAGNYEINFIGEGAANAVFQVVVQPGDEQSSIFQGYLLRVPKAGTKAHSYVELQEYWETVVRPLFEPEDLVQQRLVKLGGEGVVSCLNAALELKEEARRADFKGSRVAVAEHGMLVEDMRQSHTSDLTFEFKPKWLAQSHHAPASATRCRTCAREALRLHTKPGTARKQKQKQSPKETSPSILCPLNLLACTTSPTALTHVTAHFSTLTPPPSSFCPSFCPSIGPSTCPSTCPSTTTTTSTTTSTTSTTTATPPSHPVSPDTAQAAQHARLATWLQTNTLLPRLRAAQLAAARDGEEEDEGTADPEQLALAMTLRDCACFVRVPAEAGRPVEAKLADLDRKNWEAKRGYWREMERRLVEGGYYEGREVGGVGTDCLLEEETKKV